MCMRQMRASTVGDFHFWSSEAFIASISARRRRRRIYRFIADFTAGGIKIPRRECRCLVAMLQPIDMRHAALVSFPPPAARRARVAR